MRYAGIDTSTKSIAWGVIEDDNLLHYGELFFTKADFTERLCEARLMLEAFVNEWLYDVDYIGFEQPVSMNSRQVLIKLAKMAGVIESILIECPGRLVEVPPISWQSAIGNPLLSGKSRTEFLKLHPEFKTSSQIKTGIRQYRKNKTKEIIFDKFDVSIDSDNITDAIGVSLFCQQQLEKV